MAFISYWKLSVLDSPVRPPGLLAPRSVFQGSDPDDVAFLLKYENEVEKARQYY